MLSHSEFYLGEDRLEVEEEEKGLEEEKRLAKTKEERKDKYEPCIPCLSNKHRQNCHDNLWTLFSAASIARFLALLCSSPGVEGKSGTCLRHVHKRII